MVLRINSPGGSPVQAGYINDEIKRLRALYPNIPLYAVVEDICASGGYYVAAAADKIYVDKASIVGSIGVVMDGFGFTGTMEKLGVERRALTAGENKGFLDPFSPIQRTRRRHTRKRCSATSTSSSSRSCARAAASGSRKRRTCFQRPVWIGEKSIELGLADALGSVDSVARDVIKAEDIVDFTPRENIAERVARRFGAAMAEALVKLGGLRQLVSAALSSPAP